MRIGRVAGEHARFGHLAGGFKVGRDQVWVRCVSGIGQSLDCAGGQANEEQGDDCFKGQTGFSDHDLILLHKYVRIRIEVVRKKRGYSLNGQSLT